MPCTILIDAGDRDEDGERDGERDEPAQEAGHEDAVGEGSERDQQDIEEAYPKHVEDDRAIGPQPELQRRVDRRGHADEGEGEQHGDGIVGPAQREQEAAGEQRGAGQQAGDEAGPDAEGALLLGGRCRVDCGALLREGMCLAIGLPEDDVDCRAARSVEALGEIGDAEVGGDGVCRRWRQPWPSTGMAGFAAGNVPTTSLPLVVTSKSRPCCWTVGWTQKLARTA